MKKTTKVLLAAGLSFSLVACGQSSTNQNIIQANKNVPVNVEDADYKQVVSSQNEFAFDLYKHLERDEDGNRFVSPLSISLALTIAYNGADSETKEEMAKALKLEGLDINEVNEANYALLESLDSVDGVELNIANSLWLAEEGSFKQEFVDLMKTYYDADAGIVHTPEDINQWVEEKTKGKIDKIVEELPDLLVGYIVNAIYFKGSWTEEFNETMTSDRTFILANGTKLQLPFMYQKNDFQYFENNSFQSVKIPYGEDKEMSMVVFSPKEGHDLQEFEANLQNNEWKEWFSQYRESGGELFLPKFKLEYETELIEPLQKLGMKQAFLNGTADLSKLTEIEDAFISKVKHKSFIEVNEEGTEAAAVTSVEVTTESAEINEGFVMDVNRPFFFAIVDHKTNSILFMGSIEEPVQ